MNVEKKNYEAPLVLSVSQIRFETAVSGGGGGGGGVGIFSLPDRIKDIDFTIPFLPGSGDGGSH
jgi:hypothetical protein